jgi:hypothetical protein
LDLLLAVKPYGLYYIGGDVVDDYLIAIGGGVNAIRLIQLPIGGNTI